MTDETKTEAKPAAADPAERASAVAPDEMARLTDEIVGALKTPEQFYTDSAGQ